MASMDDLDVELSFEDLTFGDDAPKKQHVGSFEASSDHADRMMEDEPMVEPQDNVILVSTSYGGKVALNFEATMELLKEKLPSVTLTSQSHRDKQSFGFLQMPDQETREKVLEILNQAEIDGHKLNAESCRAITPGRDPRTHNFNSDYKNSTLVVKNLPFQLKQEKLEEILVGYGYKAQSVSYLYDASGMFRGMAFVKYKEVEHAAKVFELMNNLDILGRKVRIEYKRKVLEAEAVQQDDTKKLYDQLYNFRNNPNHPELSFPCSSSYQRKQLHQIAEKLGLGHYSTGEGESRFVIVKKKDENITPTPPQGEPIKGRRRSDASQKQRNSYETNNRHSFETRMSPNDHPFGSFDRAGKASKSYGMSPYSMQMRSPSNSFGTSPRSFTLTRVLGEEPLVSPSRQPKGPNGTAGFAAEYKLQRSKKVQG